MKKTIVIIQLIILIVRTGYASDLSKNIEELIQTQLPQANVGIVIKDASTDTIVYSRNANTLLMPASGTKIFTAAAALYLLSPTHQFKTTLAKTKGDYYLAFNGDPSLTEEKLNQLLKNIHTPLHSITIDSSRFQEPNYLGSTSYDDLGWYYAAPSSAVIINDNAVAYDFITDKKTGNPVRVKPKDPTRTIPIINQLTTVSPIQEKNHCSFNVEILPKNTLRLYGCMAQSKQHKTMLLAITDPVYWAKKLIQRSLKEQKISIRESIKTGRTPKEARTIADIDSDNLETLIIHMLKESDNVYSNSLVKQLGYYSTHIGSTKQGIYAIKDIIAKKTHVDIKQINLADGTGDRYTVVTPNEMVNLLTDIYQDKQLRPIFLKALPIAGVDGSLKDRMKNSPLKQKVIAKTGTMHDVSSLSGYLINNKNQVYIFSIIINGVHKPMHKAKHLEEEILAQLIDSGSIE